MLPLPHTVLTGLGTLMAGVKAGLAYHVFQQNATMIREIIWPVFRKNKRRSTLRTFQIVFTARLRKPTCTFVFVVGKDDHDQISVKAHSCNLQSMFSGYRWSIDALSGTCILCGRNPHHIATVEIPMSAASTRHGTYRCMGVPNQSRLVFFVRRFTFTPWTLPS